ncbi:MAG: acyl-ACP--UDP-N-acetylglucosamine O-acyltransferase [Gammaproteobacteria bacterium]|nr:acyl-ACP--UDP-N-acetylglucosamine O-acyltransferase [Gammaproteobacteria bacterium]MCF6229827.1 acyl-ACP--UDP-N-acetylglucosamine O-acyltransferase [Gammaproteobacteria bacterium]
MIDTRAIIDSSASIAEGVSIGPFSVIGADVVIGADCDIGPHVVINGPTEIGVGNKIHPFSSIGCDPQDKKYGGEATRLVIGDHNTIFEYVTISRGTTQDRGVTTIGSKNWIMAYVHIAHDCLVGDDTILANNVTLAGHVDVGDGAILGGFTLVHQFCNVGLQSFSQMNSVISKDVLPFLMVGGHMAKAHGLNSEGLKRRGYSADSRAALKQAYRIVFRSGLKLDEAKEALIELAGGHPEVAIMSDFLAKSHRGIVR